MKCPTTVLFVCTGNACRSQMAEAILRHLGKNRFLAFSAGTHPAGYVHPLAVQAMKQMEIPTEGQHSKSWEEFAAGPIDIIITVCDSAAAEPCPQWPGAPVAVHWSLPDPSFTPGTEEERLTRALAVAARLKRWIEQLVALPLEQMAPAKVRAALEQIPQSSLPPSAPLAGRG